MDICKIFPNGFCMAQMYTPRTTGPNPPPPQVDELLKLTLGSVPSPVAADQGQLVMDGTAKSCFSNSQHHTVTQGFPSLWMAAFYLPQFTTEDRT